MNYIPCLRAMGRLGLGDNGEAGKRVDSSEESTMSVLAIGGEGSGGGSS